MGERTTLVMPDALGLMKPKWTASPSGIIDFDDRGRTEAEVKGLKPGQVTVSAEVKGLFDSTTYSVRLTVKPAAPIQAKPGRTDPSGTEGRKPPPTNDARMNQIGDLLKRYEAELGDIRTLFDKGANDGSTPVMDEATQRRLGHITEKFFKELSGIGLSVRDLQGFKAQFMAAGPGGSPLFPGQGAWDDAFLGTERALMMGRAQLVQRLWMETLRDTFRANPDAAVFGEIDIGSWVKMRLGDLGFQSDIDFSSVSIDPALNRWIVDQFQQKLSAHSDLDMVQADALLTAHGQATPDVFIGDWGKTFAELDMLKRSKWKVIKVEKNPDGSLVLDENGQPKITMTERPGAQLFWEVAFRKLEAGRFAEVDYPKMDLAKEPMLSLEMLRHGIHDIEHGPYSRGQKLIKMLKYAERSYFMNKKAVAGAGGFNPYEANDPLLAEAASKIIANKNDPAQVADLLQALAGEEITEANVDAVTDRLVARAKTAMHDNATRALAFRLNDISKIDAEDARQSALDKLWHDLETEVRTYQDTAGRPPEVMVRALELTKAVMEGKLPPSELEARARELHALLNDSYKLPNSVIDRIMMSDSYLKVKAALRKLGWVEKSINDFIDKAKQKYLNGAAFHEKFQELNEQLNKTTAGSGLLKTADFADNAFSVYEAYLGSTADQALWNASMAMGRIGLQEKFPSLQIPLALYDSVQSRSPKPLAMAVVFMYFPFAGQTYMVSQMMGRADVAIRDAEFYGGLNKVLDVTEFDTQGKITGFSLKNILGKEIDSASISPPGNRKAIVALFTDPGGTFYTSPNFRYWSSLVPKKDDRFGLYENKLEKLRRFFNQSEDVRYMTFMLENFKAQGGKLPQDKYTAQREAALARMEDELTETLWVAMADMLESAAKSVQAGEMEAKVKKVEDDLSLGDDDLGKNKGLLAKIKWEIRQNSSLFSGENPYAVGLIYEKYLKAYERVAALRNQIILDVWHGNLGIDYVAAQGKPMKLLLIGGKSGAPALSGDPAADVELAEKTLAACRASADAIRADLAAALGRDVDDAKDKEHIRALGQLGMEREHLLDDCAARAAPNCEAGVRGALQERVRLYKDYLAKLGAGIQPIQLEIAGPAELKQGDSAEFRARFAKADDRTRPGLALRWTVNGQARGNGETLGLMANKVGSLNIGLTAWVGADKAARKLGEAGLAVVVKDGKDDKPAASANLAAEINSALKARDWKHLADMLAQVKKDQDRRIRQSEAWQADVDALMAALESLKKERMAWALAWQDYIDALNNVDSSVWDKLTREVEKKRGVVEERCWNSGSASEDSRKRTERCQKEGRKFEESCVGTWSAQHWEEMKRIRMAKQELPDAVLTLHSAGYFTHKDWFEAVEKLTEKYKLPFPYPNPVTPRLKYALSCADVDLPTGKKAQTDLSTIKVTVPAPGVSVPFGKPVALNASASGGKPPYNFVWSSGGTGTRVSVTPRWAGEWTVTVTATDADGQTGEGSATLHVSPAKVKLTGTQPTVFYGSTATLSLPGSEPPSSAPVTDPCAGKPRSNNPYDECNTIKVDPGKAVSVAPQWNDANTPAKVFNPNVENVSDPDREGPAPPPDIKGRQIVWQAEPAVTFKPPTSGDGRTKVTYDRMGEIKLWCEIQEQIEGAFHTVGECEQETIRVVAPKFSISLTPPEGQGRIGQDIRALVGSQPGVADNLIDFRWFDPPSSNRMELSANAREIGFRVKDAKPVVLKALARVPHYGDDIAEITATYTGQVYQVKAWAVEPGTRPMMWDAKQGGLVPVPKGAYATFERIPLRAEIEGGPSDGVRWNWTVNEGTTISNPISQTPTVSRSSSGGISAHVEARDAEGALLGSGDVSLSVMEVSATPPAPANPTPILTPDNATPERGQSVSISAEVSGGKAPYSYTWQGARGSGPRATATPTNVGNYTVGLTVRDSKGKTGSASLTLDVQPSQTDRDKAEAARLGDQAIKKLQQGDLLGAIQSAREGNKLDPAATRAASAKVATAAKQAGWRNVYDRDFGQAVPNLEAAHELDPTDKDAAGKLDQAKRFAQVWPQAEAKAREFDAQMAEKKIWTAQKTMLQMQDLQHEMTGGMANPLSKRVTDDFNAGMAEYNRFMQDVNARHRAYFQEKNWQAMLDNAQEALKREHVLANEKELNSNVAFAKQMLREQAATVAPSVVPQGSAQGDAIVGTWAINANNYRGKLEITRQGGQLVGRVWYDAHSRWEDLRDISFDGHSLTFTRPIPGLTQRYTGTLTGNEFRGTFSQEGTSTIYSWSASGSPGMGVPQSGQASVADFAWLGMDEDRVGDWGNGKPNGTKDGHFRLTLDITGKVNIASIAVYSANEKGDKAGGQVWHSQQSSNWMLGLFRDGRQLNASHVSNLGDFVGSATIDLYANSSGWFNKGQRFLLEVTLGSGQVLSRSLVIGIPADATAGTASTSGLIAAYALDGDARDGSGHNLHGTVRGAQTTADRFGRASGAMQMDGKSFIELPIDINPAIYPQLTFTAWVRADEISPIRQVMSHDDGGYDRSLGIDTRGGGAGWSLFTGTSGVLGLKPVDKGRWTFVAGVWDQIAHKARLHVDGQVFEKAGDSGSSGQKLNLGRNPGSGENFVGAIDDVRLYGRAIDPIEINAIRNGQGGGAAPATADGYGDWAVVETTPGMYRLEQDGGQVKIARQRDNPGGLQHAGLRLNSGLPVTGDFDAQVSFSDARIDGGINQIELHAIFADGSIFFVVRDREGSGSHIWAPGLQGNQPCGRVGTLRVERRGETVTGYCDGRAIWSAPHKAALTKLQFVLQNNGTNDPISATFQDWRFNGGATTNNTGYTPTPASSTQQPSKDATLTEQIDAIKDTWKGLKGLFGK